MTALRKQFLADLDAAPQLAPWKGKVAVQDYSPTNPMAVHVGLLPGVTIQAPPGKDGKGKVLSYSKDYPGTARLAVALELAEARRVKDPSFDPTRAPDLSQQPTPAPVLPPVIVPMPVPVAPQPAVGLDAGTGATLAGGSAVLVLVLQWLGKLLAARFLGGSPSPVVPAPAPQPNPVPLPRDDGGGGLLDGLLKDRPIIRLLLDRILNRFGDRLGGRRRGRGGGHRRGRRGPARTRAARPAPTGPPSPRGYPLIPHLVYRIHSGSGQGRGLVSRNRSSPCSPC